jgi:hypothetical protein
MNRQINSFVGLFLGVLLFSSCENVLEMPENQNFNSELGEYLESAEFVSFQSSFPDFSSKLNFELLKKVELNISAKAILLDNIYITPTEKKNETKTY